MDQPLKGVDRKIVTAVDEYWLGKLQEVAHGVPIDFKVLRSVLVSHPRFVAIIAKHRYGRMSFAVAVQRLKRLYPRFLRDYAAAMAAKARSPED